MSFTIVNCEQRSDEWYAARLGKLTGSCANDMLTTIKSGESAARRNLRVRLTLERITGKSQESNYCSVDMQNGIEREVDAVALYEALTGRLVDRVGFLQHTSLLAGCSPDGILGDFDGLVSVKCPKEATHLEYLETKKVPTEYLRQIVHEMWISGAAWCDFLSYQPSFPEEIRTCLVRVERIGGPVDVNAYDAAARTFLKEVDDKVEAVRKLMQREPAVA